MLFLFFNSAKFQFGIKKLIQGYYTTGKLLLTIKRIKHINKHEFDKISLNKNSETFVIHVTTLKVSEITIYPF